MASGEAANLNNTLENALEVISKMIYIDKKIAWCNGMEPRAFRKADIGYSKREIQNGVYLQYLFQPGIEMIKTQGQHGQLLDEVQRLFTFMKDADNQAKSILKGLAADSKHGVTVAALLAVHLFQELLPDKAVTIDDDHMFEIKKFSNKCPCGCGGTFKAGNTGIGAPRVWHGYPDMMLCNAPVTVANIGEDPEDEVSGSAPKKPRLGTEYADTNETCVGTIKDESVVHQVIAQTITSAFAQGNEKEELDDRFIPAICISARDVAFFAYNVKYDWLITTFGVRSLFNGDKFNLTTLIEIWLILNMGTTAKSAVDFNADAKKFEESGFKALMQKSGCYDVYKKAEVHLENFSSPFEPHVKFYDFDSISLDII